MNIILTKSGDWLLQKEHWFNILCFVCAVSGTLYVVPDIFRKKRKILRIVTQMVSSIAIGGLAFGVLTLIACILLMLVLNIGLHVSDAVLRNSTYFLHLVLVSVPSFPYGKTLPHLFALFFVVGAIIGMIICHDNTTVKSV